MPQRTAYTFGSVLVLIAITALSLPAGAAAPEFRLKYAEPAKAWTEALPVGNGRIGAMVFGGTDEERLQINESTLWGGEPHDYSNPGAYANLDRVRELIFGGKVAEAEALSTAMMGVPKLLMPYQPFCDIRLRFPGHREATDYLRDLNISDAVAETTYRVGTANFRREVFVSYLDQVLVIRIVASQPGQITFSVGMDSPQPAVTVQSTSEDTLQLTGQIQPRQNLPRSWTGSWNQPGMQFAAVMKVRAEGGSLRSSGGILRISNADAVTILFSNATSFRNYRDIGGDALEVARGYVQVASRRTYDDLKLRHEEDFHSLFSRVQLTLGDDRTSEPTDHRIRDFAVNDDPSLVALYFEFGRYLLISCSRPGGQPANLQGIWNQDLVPPWSSKWTTNINLEMNYWQADTGDLWETEAPLWNLIDDLRVTGARTARVQYHAKGWVLHHNTDIWRATAPVDGPWGIWPVGEAWLANQMWDHYEFSGDREFLRKQAYPAMKEAAEFIIGFLVEAPPGTPFAGRLVTSPSTSPENRYILGGKPESLTYAATMDLELIHELFENCRHASEILGADAQFRSQLAMTEKRLPPLQIGSRGQVQEWIEDYPEAEPAHRHVSHLYSLYPGRDINLDTTPQFAAAAEKTLELRGDGGTGWSEVWRTALWARLRNPERAYANLKLLITKNTLPDMFDLCPPFQIDGNLGAPAAITEMLVQSSESAIRVLPALPQQWPIGNLKGVRVRGGGKVDLEWHNGHLALLRLSADHSVRYRVFYQDRSAEIELAPGRTVVLDGALHKVNE
jgi:alpha-L-fucosidase 2